MKLAQSNYDNSETSCCARLDEERWDGRVVEWKEKPFLKDHVRSFLHVPLNFGSVMSRDHTAIEQAAAYPEEPLWLTDEVSPWRSDVYVAVDRDVPNAAIEKLSGTFLTRVFKGPYRDVRKWMRTMEQHLAERGLTSEQTYFYFATCPRCAKHYGENTVVLFAKVA